MIFKLDGNVFISFDLFSNFGSCSIHIQPIIPMKLYFLLYILILDHNPIRQYWMLSLAGFQPMSQVLTKIPGKVWLTELILEPKAQGKFYYIYIYWKSVEEYIFYFSLILLKIINIENIYITRIFYINFIYLYMKLKHFLFSVKTVFNKIYLNKK